MEHVCLILSLSCMKGYASHQVDFLQAFTQAPLEEHVYMKVPQGWHIQQGCLTQHTDPLPHYIQLLKTLYSVKQAAQQWYKHITVGLIKLGFKTSHIDPCLYIRHDCLIMLLYVDDCLFFTQQPSDRWDHHKVISHFQDWWPGYHTGLPRDLYIHGRKWCNLSTTTRSHQWNTPRSAITRCPSQTHPYHSRAPSWLQWAPQRRALELSLGYREIKFPCPDSMAVHNCACFSNSPTQLHEQAVKRIGCYLAHTKTKGVTYQPDKSETLNMCIDADFAGTWHKEFSHLRDSILSWSGYVIIYNGCPIQWGSKLQSEIALGMTERNILPSVQQHVSSYHYAGFYRNY